MHLLSIFDNIDILKILGFGLSGLSLLLMVLAYQLLKQLINTPNPNPSVINLVKLFLGSNILVLIVVGLFSIPIASKNSQLGNKVENLNNEKQQIVKEVSVLQKLSVADTVHTIPQFNAYVAQAKLQADSLKTFAVTTNNEQLKEQANTLIADLDKSIISINTDSSTALNNEVQLIKAKNNIKQLQQKIFINPTLQISKE